jgi:hypothetical protein
MNPALLKAAAGATLSVALLAASFALGARYEAGEQAKVRETVLQREIARMEAIWEEDRRLLLEARIVERQVQTVYREIYREAETVATPDCADLGPEWLGLYNRAIEAAGPALTR